MAPPTNVLEVVLLSDPLRGVGWVVCKSASGLILVDWPVEGEPDERERLWQHPSSIRALRVWTPRLSERTFRDLLWRVS
jgi:hypothetical protein